MSKRILTGDRPTGPLHIGHYAGSLQERLRTQADPSNECFFIIADYQVLTDRLDTQDVERHVMDVATDYLSVGIDPDRSTTFVQSQVPQLADLFVLLSMLTTMSKVKSNPTVKEEVQAAGLGANMSLGMLSYPVSQAADILLFQPDFVPVGEDQLPHIELTREIARTFNNRYGEVFKIPEATVSAVPRLLGLDGNQKMSKSRGNAIFLSDPPDTVRKKIKSAVTDSDREIRYDPVARPAVSNLLSIYQIATGDDMMKIEQRFAGKGYGDLKQELTDAVIDFLAPIQQRRAVFEENRYYVTAMLRGGTERAIAEGTKTLRKVREAMKLDFSRIFRP